MLFSHIHIIINYQAITNDALSEPADKIYANWIFLWISFQRHSHPEYDCERPLSEVNSEFSYDALSDKHMFKSSNDIHHSNGRIYGDHDGSGSSQRGSLMSSENSESGRMISGARRNLPKHQRPLTRYLPIMSADLDLRLHIESAGHQVTLCPHVRVDSYSCRGYVV